MKWRAIIVGAVILPVLFSMVGCSARSELSRGKAAEVIYASDKFTPAEYREEGNPLVFLTEDQFRMGVEQGLWQKDPSNPWGATLTPKGKTAFQSISNNLSSWYLTPKPIPRRVIEVTGLADGAGTLGPPGTTKEAQFTWKWDWDAVPKEAKPFFGAEPKPSKGQAVLKLYDDGWRVEEIKVD